MKILLVSRFFPYIGGRETIVLLLAEELSSRGHDVAVLTPDMGRPSLGYKTYKYEQNVDSIKKVLDDFKPDIISSHTFYFTPLVVEANKDKKVPFTITVHGDLLNYGKKEDQQMFLDLVPSMNKVISVCEQGNNQMIVKGKLPEDKLSIIKYGIDTELFNKASFDKDKLRELFKLPKDKFIFVTPARMTPYKGIEFLIDSVESMKDIKNLFFLISTPPARHREDETTYTEKIFSILAEKGLDKNFSLGFFDFNTMPLLYNSCDAFILPSMTEQLPVSILEAQSSQIPVIATNVGGVSEIVRNLETGYLVNYGNKEELTDAIEKIYSDKVSRKNVVSNAREMIIKAHKKELMTDKYLELFQRLTEK